MTDIAWWTWQAAVHLLALWGAWVIVVDVTRGPWEEDPEHDPCWPCAPKGLYEESERRHADSD